jgi:hypothetical protein
MAVTRMGVRGKAPGKSLGSRSVAPIPLEWMGPPAWRLPSGKALAEFALQAGFLAPLLLGDGPFWKRKPTSEPRLVGNRRQYAGEGRNGLGQ